jgi:hypothetical protein
VSTVTGVTSHLVVVEQEEPLAEWLEPSLNDTAGRDPLGLNTITLDRVLPDLIPGILQISERARYFSIYPWMLWQYAERRLPATPTELDRFIRQREYELCLAMKLCRHCEAGGAIGGRSAGPRISAGDDPLDRGVSVQTPMGGFGLYYRSPLEALGAVAPAGALLGPDETPTPIEVLAQDDLGRELAEAFHASIEGTEYYRRYERTGDPIPRQVLEELAEQVCLCRLRHRPEERDAIRRLLFEPRSEATADECDARRRAFALFLGQVDDNARVAFEDGEFWRNLIGRFQAQPNDDSVRGRTVAAWGALAMKECAQDALCSVWTDFCRSGVTQQGLDGMTAEELRAMIEGLATATELEFAGADLEIAATDPALEVQERAVEAARELDWEQLRAWAATSDSAIAGLVVLLVFAARMPNPDRVHPLWREIAARRSEHQDGLLGLLSLVRRFLADSPPLGELLARIVRRFVIGPHEAIAYSKLPEATFRFYWEETGRFRFFRPGSGGLDRFRPSDDRRGPMASLSEDIGLWDRGQNTGEAALTDDGRAFVAEVLG